MIPFRHPVRRPFPHVWWKRHGETQRGELIGIDPDNKDGIALTSRGHTVTLALADFFTDEALPGAKFKIGDPVTFVNDYGLVFYGKTVTRVQLASQFWGKPMDGFVYFIAPSDCHWSPVREDQLREGVKDTFGQLHQFWPSLKVGDRFRDRQWPDDRGHVFVEDVDREGVLGRRYYADGRSDAERVHWPRTAYGEWIRLP